MLGIRSFSYNAYADLNRSDENPSTPLTTPTFIKRLYHRAPWLSSRPAGTSRTCSRSTSANGTLRFSSPSADAAKIDTPYPRYDIAPNRIDSSTWGGQCWAICCHSLDAEEFDSSAVPHPDCAFRNLHFAREDKSPKQLLVPAHR
jgi:hypothetical protein